MDSSWNLSCWRVLLVCVVTVLFTSGSLCLGSESHHRLHFRHLERREIESRSRRLLESEAETPVKTKKVKSVGVADSSQTKLVMQDSSKKNQTKIKLSLSSKNLTKLVKPTNSTSSKLKIGGDSLAKSEFKQLNSTSLSKKLSNSTVSSKLTNSTKKHSDLLKVVSPLNKTKSVSTKETQSLLEKKLPVEPKIPKAASKGVPAKQKLKSEKQPSWLEDDDDNDLVADIRDLPNNFQKSLFPDIARMKVTSKKYLTRANKEMMRGIKPIVGNKYAPTIASFVSFAFIIIPLVLVSLLFNRIKSYFSLQKVLIFIQIYLAIYFSILCLSSVVTGFDPLKFFYATSTSTYLCVMVLQTLAYVLYLLMLLMYLILVFSTESTMACKMLGLGQTFVGFSVGLHFYMAVFHRVVLHQPPKTNWKIHGAYAACFLLICALSAAEKRKKKYLEEGGEEGKKN